MRNSGGGFQIFIGFEHFTGKTSTSAQQNIQIERLIIAFTFSKLMRTFPVGHGASFSPELMMSHGRINPEHRFLPYYDGKQFKSHQASGLFYVLQELRSVKMICCCPDLKYKHG